MSSPSADLPEYLILTQPFFASFVATANIKTEVYPSGDISIIPVKMMKTIQGIDSNIYKWYLYINIKLPLYVYKYPE